MLRTFAVACEAYLTIPAVLGERIAFVHPETVLLLGTSKAGQGTLHDIPQAVLRIDIVIAGKEISVVFQGQSSTAALPKYTQTLRHANPAFQ